ncbi:hypothetical protein C8D76_1248 [Pasteurella langaaensis DSM 22999]|uniref:YcjX family protein n=1 Tax=Alitibacter langaaensis DSM 22999 TaxID=1122935 RepID=A0A2U0SK29_9PAST|nr:YcjX family protein [Pasteurella langaaensis]PVX31698.1 hypothetical protein C8D76_1248 [Pasteurella langaaensis DSM 22999]
MFNRIQKEITQVFDRTLDRSLRIAVTGLSRSGKTAFITSLINQLMYINQENNRHVPLFEAARNGRLLGVKRIPQRDLRVPRFDYEANLSELSQNPPHFPQSTRGISETRLAIRYQKQRGLMSLIKERGTLYLDIFDYPGEWLLDLPLLGQSFQQWSQNLSELHQGKRAKLAQNWLKKAKNLDLSAVANEEVLANLAKDYTDYLHACKAEGLNFIQPGRFVLPAELAGSPSVQFFPLIWLKQEEWQQLEKTAKSTSYFAMLKDRYRYYRKHIVKAFYENYFSHFDRQVILADCLTPLNHSREAFEDMQQALHQLFSNFHYGKRNLLNRLFAPKIDKLMFIATKADHITSDQLPNLTSLMRQLVQDGGRYAEFEGVELDYSAIAAIRSTQQVNVNQNGETFKAIRGVRSSDKQQVTVYPGSVPAKLPKAEFWATRKFEFDQFEPQPLEQGEPIPHLRMDVVAQFLLGDKLQ